MSICNGSTYKVGPGGGIYGLVSSLISAGAKNVLGTLWKIIDEEGKDFMIQFYKHLLSYGPSEAHRLSCISAIKKKSWIRSWASFTLIGEGRKNFEWKM